MENIHYDAMMDYTAPAVTSVIKFSTKKIKKPEDVFTYEFQNLVMMLLQLMEEKDKTYKQAIDEIDLVTKFIDEELRKILK